MAAEDRPLLHRGVPIQTRSSVHDFWSIEEMFRTNQGDSNTVHLHAHTLIQSIQLTAGPIQLNANDWERGWFAQLQHQVAAPETSLHFCGLEYDSGKVIGDGLRATRRCAARSRGYLYARFGLVTVDFVAIVCKPSGTPKC